MVWYILDKIIEEYFHRCIVKMNNRCLKQNAQFVSSVFSFIFMPQSPKIIICKFGLWLKYPPPFPHSSKDKIRKCLCLYIVKSINYKMCQFKIPQPWSISPLTEFVAGSTLTEFSNHFVAKGWSQTLEPIIWCHSPNKRERDCFGNQSHLVSRTGHLLSYILSALNVL